MTLNNKIKGTGVALVTPFNKDFSIDFKQLGALIDYVIKGGADYLVLLGTTGEAATLDWEEKIDLFYFCLDHVANRVPIVVGIGGNNTNNVVDELEHFPLNGAKAVLSVSPSYNKPSQEGVFQHYKAIAAASALPIIMYNVPGRTARNLHWQTTIRIAQEIPNILGIKEAHNDIDQAIQIAKHKPEGFLVISGDDSLAVPHISIGFDGLISVAANVWPKEISNMVRNALIGDYEGARKELYPLISAIQLLFEENNPAGAKAFMYEKGLLENVLRLPLTAVNNGLQKKIREIGV